MSLRLSAVNSGARGALCTGGWPPEVGARFRRVRCTRARSARERAAAGRRRVNRPLSRLRGVVNRRTTRWSADSLAAATATTRSGRAANLALLAFERFGQAADRRTADATAGAVEGSITVQLAGRPASMSAWGGDVAGGLAAPAAVPTAVDTGGPRTADSEALPQPPARTRRARCHRAPSTPAVVMIRDIKRTALAGWHAGHDRNGRARPRTTPSGSRTRAACFSISRARGPSPSLLDATLKFTDDIVREIRLGRHPQTTTRIVHGHGGRGQLQRLHAVQSVPAGHRLQATADTAHTAVRPPGTDDQATDEHRRPVRDAAGAVQ